MAIDLRQNFSINDPSAIIGAASSCPDGASPLGTSSITSSITNVQSADATHRSLQHQGAAVKIGKIGKDWVLFILQSCRKVLRTKDLGTLPA
jgi:hypothetical protein